MTTQREYEHLPTFTKIHLTPISSDPDEDWLHPVLEIFRPEPVEKTIKKPSLYLVPSTFGEEFDAEFAPQPTSATDLPNIEKVVTQFIHNVLEIWAGRRSAQQVQMICHYKVFAQFAQKKNQVSQVGRIRKIRITQPLDGISESTVTVRYGDRLRVVAIRFEGIDGRWLCTSLHLL